MDYGKFPRQRGLPASSDGARQARFLDTLGTPALRRKNADGSVSHKQGERLWVTPGEQQLPDGFFALGMVGGQTHVFASATARGVFLDRGAFMGDDGLVPWDVNRLYNQQRGWGLVVASESVDSTPDFNGMPALRRKITLARTRNGRQFEVVGEYLFVMGWDSWNSVARFGTCLPTRLRDGVEVLAGLSAVGLSVTGDYVPVYAFDNTQPVVLPTRMHQVLYTFFVSTLAPRVRLGQVRYTRAIYQQLPHSAGGAQPVPFPANNALNPGIDIYFSSSRGASWGWAGLQAAFREFTETAVPMDVPPDVAAEGLWTPRHAAINTLFNQVVAATHVFDPCPVSVHQALALASVGYVVPDPATESGWKAMCKAKVVVVDNQAQTITEAALLQDTDLSKSYGYTGASVAIGGGMLFQLKPRTTPDFRDGEVQCWFVELGGSPVFKATMPTPAWLTGNMFAIDRSTAGCTLYEGGAYWLYESRDLGATWRRRARIVAADMPEKVDGVNYLINFEHVTQLINEGATANPMPGAPWACDERVEAPTI